MGSNRTHVVIVVVIIIGILAAIGLFAYSSFVQNTEVKTIGLTATQVAKGVQALTTEKEAPVTAGTPSTVPETIAGDPIPSTLNGFNELTSQYQKTWNDLHLTLTKPNVGSCTITFSSATGVSNIVDCLADPNNNAGGNNGRNTGSNDSSTTFVSYIGTGPQQGCWVTTEQTIQRAGPSNSYGELGTGDRNNVSGIVDVNTGAAAGKNSNKFLFL